MTSTELAHQIVHPLTGELIPTKELRKVADAIEDVRLLEARLRDAKAELTEVLAEHARRIGTKTFSVEGRTVIVSPDKELKWDVDELVKLLELGLPEETYDRLVTAVVTYKVNAAVANQIASANEEYAEIIARAKSYEPKRQYVSLRPIDQIQR
jgi:hypothetical protein